ncbi:MAG TPA: hypothetical protein VN803_06855 [Gemmatimonadales bacterium]|nr:hypothetical protein [Gemmatimonadales bacterium]
MASRYKRSWSDAAIQGQSLSGATAALRELDQILGLEDDVRDDIRTCTEDAHRDALARWNASAGQSSRNTLDRSGARRTTSRTQRYREAIGRIFFDDGMTGKVFVRFPIRGSKGDRPVNLPLWLEHGTRYMSARPHLIPAFEIAKRKLERLIERRLNAAPRG